MWRRRAARFCALFAADFYIIPKLIAGKLALPVYPYHVNQQSKDDVLLGGQFMPIPLEITALVERLNQELDIIEREVTSGLNLAKAILERFPNNFTVIQLSAFLTTASFSGETSKRRIQALVESLAAVDVFTDAEIQELGEDLATDLGRAMETKIRVSQVKTRLENLQ